MISILAVGVGGCLGSIMRYLLVQEFGRQMPHHVFPWGTLAVNVIGCFVIALIGELAAGKMFLNAEGRLFIFVGILGGFTTFSAFGYETFEFIKNSQLHLAFLNIAAQIFLGFAAVAAGYFAGRLLAS